MARITATGYMSSKPVTPQWVGDELNREHLVPGGARLDWSAFMSNNTQAVTANGLQAAGLTTLTVDALTKAIPAGGFLITDLTPESPFITIISEAKVGDTVLQVDPLPFEVADNAVFQYVPMKVYVPSGTLVGRTWAERAANTGFGPAADADDEVYLIAFDVEDVQHNPDCELYRHGSIVKENYLPVFTGLSATLQGKIRSQYQTTLGAP
jgi:hypothetical protein